MSNIFFIADTHFGHANISKYCNRPFSSKEMDEMMIERWNNVVKCHDLIYHLGDFAFCCSPAYAENVLKHLNGQIYLCKGSHDKIVLKNKCRTYFADIQESFYLHIHKGIFLAHCCHKVWHKSHHGSWHLFGHSHGGLDNYAHNEGKLLDVGVDSNDFTPWHIDEVRAVMAKRPLNFNDLQRREN